MRLAVRGERLENFAGDFRRDAGAGVLHFGDDFDGVELEAKENVPAIEHHVGGACNSSRFKWRNNGMASSVITPPL